MNVLRGKKDELKSEVCSVVKAVKVRWGDSNRKDGDVDGGLRCITIADEAWELSQKAVAKETSLSRLNVSC